MDWLQADELSLGQTPAEQSRSHRREETALVSEKEAISAFSYLFHRVLLGPLRNFSSDSFGWIDPFFYPSAGILEQPKQNWVVGASEHDRFSAVRSDRLCVFDNNRSGEGTMDKSLFYQGDKQRAGLSNQHPGRAGIKGACVDR